MFALLIDTRPSVHQHSNGLAITPYCGDMQRINVE